jgi:serine/threonine-protein kinase
MGVVYRARQLALGRTVALKMILAGACAGEEDRARFQREAEAIARLSHPNIVAVYEVGEHDGRPFLALEFCPGGSLADRLDGTPLPAGEAARLVQTLARAMQAAHDAQVVHRDLKPANVLLAADGTPRVTDFGLARNLDAAGAGPAATQSGAVLGTPSYMAPEQASGRSREVGPAADVYALGAILYECLTGRPPFKAVTVIDTLMQVLNDEPVPPRQLQSQTPRDLETICLKCLRKEPARRYGSAAELADDLSRQQRGEPIRARPVGPPEQALKWVKRKPAVAGLLAAVLVLVAGLAGGGVWAWQQVAGRWQAAARALVDAEEHRKAGRWSEMRSAVERAQGWLAGGGPAGLRSQAGRDAEVVIALDRVRLRQAEVKDGHFDDLSADEGYAAAFRDYGVDVDGPDPDEAAARVRGSEVRDHLLAALDHWSAVRRKKRDREGAARVQAVADRADGNEWRAGLRAAVADDDLGRLRGLAAQATGQPPAVRLVLTRALRARAAAREAEGVLRRGLAEYPDDFWLATDLGSLLYQGKRWGEAEGFFRLALGLRPGSPAPWLNLGIALGKQGPSALDDAVACYRRALQLDPDYAHAHGGLGIALEKQGKLDDAVACFRRATRLDPDYAEAHHNLGVVLEKQGKRDDAVACYRRALQLDLDYAPAHKNLGAALEKQGNLEEAVACHRRAIRLDPDYAEAHHNLGVALEKQGKVADAVACYRRAVQLDPNLALAHYNLGNALGKQGKVDEALACYRRAIRLDPDFASAHNNLGAALEKQGKGDEAVACYRRAVQLDPNLALAHNNLGVALGKQGKLDEAADCYRRAIQHEPDFAFAHNNLGTVLGQQGKLAEAVDCFRRATRLDPNYPEAHGNLGHALRQQGRFADALAALERGHQLGSRFAGGRGPSADQVRDCRRLVEQEARLPAVLAGTDRPADTADRLGFIRVCVLTRRFAAAARLSAEAFASQPRLAEDLRAGHRYNAACYAARAGGGQGEDTPALAPADRLRWRRQALTWLRDDLTAWERRLAADRSAGPSVAQKLRRWQGDSDLAGLRDPSALARLAADERGACERLWADVAALLQRAQTRK